MTRIPTPELGRRRFVASSLAAAGMLLLPRKADAQAKRVATPAQTEGPFCPTKFPADIDNDLVQIRGADARAEGIVTHITGRILGRDGKPIANARVEIWQCDQRGNYIHPEGGSGKGARDRAFQGFGSAISNADGMYRFRTIRPVAYPGRTPHIHFSVAAGRTKLVTQMYVAGEPLNAGDGLYRSLRDAKQREAVTVRLDPANGVEDGALAGEFDLVMRT